MLRMLRGIFIGFDFVAAALNFYLFSQSHKLLSLLAGVFVGTIGLLLLIDEIKDR